mgnify:CR=1 FL=1
MKTALGFLYWAEKNADWVALEVGLGGRLDATNVVDPACCVIVSIGLDHTAILGDTLSQIAREKAGIIKPGRPVIVGEMPEEAREVIEQVAQENGSPIVLYGHDLSWNDGTVQTARARYEGLRPGIKGVKQSHNLALAVAALEAVGAIKDASQLALGAATASLPGRFEMLKCRDHTFILDGAHNPQAAEHLVQTLRAERVKTPLTLVTGRIEGHASRPFYEALQPAIARAHVARIAFHRSRSPQEVIAECAGVLTDATAQGSAEEALAAAIKGTRPGGTILVTGSFYLVGEVGNLLSK